MAMQGKPRSGFTLVELMVVILIVTILMGLLFVAVRGVWGTANDSVYAAEISQLELAIDAYKNKYSDYPPDFADVNLKPWTETVVYRHIRKAFPRIANDELANIQAFVTTFGVDHAEALWFWLGGLSNNPRYPFSGAGGPLIVDTQNNTIYLRVQERNEPLYTFNEGRLRWQTDSNNNPIGASYLPPGGRKTPFVYFDSRTYAFIGVDSNGNPTPYYSFYPAAEPDGVGFTHALPYKSDTVNTNFDPNNNPSDALLRDRAVHFANRDTFQILCAGYDDMFGPVGSLANTPMLIYNDQNSNFPVPLFTRHQSGFAFHPTVAIDPPSNMNTSVNPSWLNYRDGQEDNVTNFSDGRRVEGSWK